MHRIRELRRARGLSQVEFCARMGVSQGTLSSWESGRFQPDIEKLGRMADEFCVTTDYLLGRGGPPPGERRAESMPRVAILGCVRAGFGEEAVEEIDGWEVADVRDPDEYCYLRVRGDSMSPRIEEGDLALVHWQPDVDSGQLAIVLVGGEEGTIKKVVKRGGSVILQPFNPDYAPVVLAGEALRDFTVLGRVVETKRRW